VHGQTLEKHLLAAGIERRRDTPVVQAQKAVETKTRYGHTDAHRRLTAEQAYPSCLTDTEWALVKEALLVVDTLGLLLAVSVTRPVFRTAMAPIR